MLLNSLLEYIFRYVEQKSSKQPPPPPPNKKKKEKIKTLSNTGTIQNSIENT